MSSRAWRIIAVILAVLVLIVGGYLAASFPCPSDPNETMGWCGP